VLAAPQEGDQRFRGRQRLGQFLGRRGQGARQAQAEAAFVAGGAHDEAVWRLTCHPHEALRCGIGLAKPAQVAALRILQVQHGTVAIEHPCTTWLAGTSRR